VDRQQLALGVGQALEQQLVGRAAQASHALVQVGDVVTHALRHLVCGRWLVRTHLHGRLPIAASLFGEQRAREFGVQIKQQGFVEHPVGVLALPLANVDDE